MIRFQFISSCILSGSFLCSAGIGHAQQKPALVAYWAGYENSNGSLPVPLNRTPPGVSCVNLAFGCPIGDSLTLKFLSSFYAEQQIYTWAQGLRSRGQKVLMSIGDDDKAMWSNINKVTFARNMADIVVKEWNLDGADINAESNMPVDVYAANFIELILEFRKALGPDKTLTYTCYTGSDQDKEILQAAGHLLDGVNLMAYGDDEIGMVELFHIYAAWIDPSKITIGVQPVTTPLGEVKELACWQPSGAKKRGMMLWNLNEDSPSFSYSNAIANNLNRTCGKN